MGSYFPWADSFGSRSIASTFLAQIILQPGLLPGGPDNRALPLQACMIGSIYGCNKSCKPSWSPSWDWENLCFNTVAIFSFCYIFRLNSTGYRSITRVCSWCGCYRSTSSSRSSWGLWKDRKSLRRDSSTLTVTLHFSTPHVSFLVSRMISRSLFQSILFHWFLNCPASPSY